MKSIIEGEVLRFQIDLNYNEVIEFMNFLNNLCETDSLKFKEYKQKMKIVRCFKPTVDFKDFPKKGA